MTEAETARALYDRLRADSGYGLAPYRTVQFIAQMMRRDPMTVLHAIGFERVATDDAAAFTCPCCGAVSHNSNDVRERYCSRCHRFVDDPVEAMVSDLSDTKPDKPDTSGEAGPWITW